MNRAFLGAWLALTLVQAFWWWPAAGPLAIALVPLLVMSAWLVRPTGRSRAAAALLSLPYFVLATTEWMVDGEYPAAFTLLCCTVLYLLIVAIDVRQRRSRQPRKGGPEGQ